MHPQDLTSIIRFLKDNIEPIEDQNYGPGYRASAVLTDGTPISCVIFRNPKTIVELAMRRFDQERSGKGIFSRSSGLGYKDIVKTFVAGGNKVASYHIAGTGKSRFAFPLYVLRQIKGETAMSWTAFVARFRNERLLSFGTTWSTEFFDLPEGYDSNEISGIISGRYLLKTGEMIGHHDLKPGEREPVREAVHREKPFFECFLDDL